MKAGARSDAIKIPNFCYLFSAVSYSERHIKITYCIYRARWFCHPEAAQTHIYSITHVTNTLIHRWKGLTVVVTSMYCFFFFWCGLRRHTADVIVNIYPQDRKRFCICVGFHETERETDVSCLTVVTVSVSMSGDGLGAASLQPHVHAGDSERVWAVT